MVGRSVIVWCLEKNLYREVFGDGRYTSILLVFSDKLILGGVW